MIDDVSGNGMTPRRRVDGGLVDATGKPTVSAHRFRHTIGTQLAEGGARLQTIMAVLGHRTPHMSMIYSSLSDPTSSSNTNRP